MQQLLQSGPITIVFQNYFCHKTKVKWYVLLGKQCFIDNILKQFIHKFTIIMKSIRYEGYAPVDGPIVIFWWYK